jgi:uncharacterized protein
MYTESMTLRTVGHPLAARARVVIIGLSMATAIPLGAAVEPIASIPNPRVRDGTWVTDIASGLRADTIAQLNASLAEFEQTTSAEMAVVVVRSLDGMSVEEYASKLFALWGIGKKGQDNGLLFLWSTGDRRVRVEVGYGLEGVLPDSKVGAILDTYVIPSFKAAQFDAGVLAGVDALLKPVYDLDYSFFQRIWYGLLGIVPATIGSIVGFRRWRRYRRRTCPQCQSRMQRLAEVEDDALLNEGQQAEERVGSVDYDAWKCAACSHQFVLRYPAWLSSYEKCPQCHNRTKSSKETVLQAATTSSSGSARVDETCAFCNFRNSYTKVIPRVQRSSSSGSSRGGSSSFGGGRSGGGGASRGY